MQLVYNRPMRSGQIIPRKSGGFLVRVFVGRDATTGKKQYHNHRVKGTKKDAEKYLRAVLREQDLGIFLVPTKQTLGEFLDRWLDHMRQRVKAQTHRNYDHVIKLYLPDALRLKKLSDIRPIDVQDNNTQLLKRGIKASTVRMFHAVLSAAFRQAVKWQQIPLDPTKLVDLPRVDRTEMLALAPNQAQQFLEACSVHPCGLIYIIALFMGFRPGEYLGMKWADVDFERGTVTIQRTLVRVRGNRWEFSEPKTAYSRRRLALPELIVSALKKHRAAQNETRLKAGDRWHDYGLIFTTKVGNPLNHTEARRWFKEILTAAKLPSTYRLYDLRHSCATLLLAAGENIKVISERLGHSSVKITLDTYCHTTTEMQERANDRMQQVLLWK